MEVNMNRLLVVLRGVALVVSSIISAFFLLFIIGQTVYDISSIQKGIPGELVLLIALMGLAVVGTMVAWFSALIGGVLLMAGGIGVALHFLLVVQSVEGGVGNIMMALQAGFPYTASGLILLLYWFRVERGAAIPTEGIKQPNS